MRKFIFSPSFLYLLPILMMLVVLNGCTKKLTKTDVVYENDFERLGQQTVKIFDFYGPVTTSKIFDFNGSKVLGPFNNNAAIIPARVRTREFSAVDRMKPPNFTKSHFINFMHTLHTYYNFMMTNIII